MVKFNIFSEIYRFGIFFASSINQTYCKPKSFITKAQNLIKNQTKLKNPKSKPTKPKPKGLTLKSTLNYTKSTLAFAFFCLLSGLSIASEYKFIGGVGVAGGGKLVANGVDIGWLNFTNGVPLAASFGGKSRIRYISVDTNNTIDIMLVGLEGNNLIIDDFDEKSAGRVNIITTIPDKVYVNGKYAQNRITINGQAAIGKEYAIEGPNETLIGKAYTGAGSYKMDNAKLTIKEVVAGVNGGKENFFKIDTGGREVEIIIQNKEHEKYVIVDDLPYTQWLAQKQTSNKSNSPTNSANSTNPSNANALNSQSITLNSLLAQRKSYTNLAKIADTNTMLIYNMLHNYEGTYLAYDYGLANTISVGAFQNGFFARYYTKQKLNDSGQEYGYDIGLKFRSKWTKANLYYSDYFQRSVVATLGLKKDFSFGLGDNFALLLTPSIEANYAYTFQKDYIPQNHLGFFNASLEAGVRLWRTTLLAKASAGLAKNSLKSISLDDGAFRYEPSFIKNVYSLGVGVSQRLFGGLEIAAEAGYVYLDKQFWEKGQLKSGVFRANAMIIYRFRSNRFDNIMGYYDDDGRYVKSNKKDKYGRNIRKSKVSSRG